MKSIIQVGVACFVWKDGKFLMGQRRGSHGSNTWAPPGGKLEYGESWENCAKRETLEETGIITNAQFLAVTNDVFEVENKHFVTLWIKSDWLSGKPTILEPDKCTALEWRTFQTLPSPLFEPCWQNLRKARPELFV